MIGTMAEVSNGAAGHVSCEVIDAVHTTLRRDSFQKILCYVLIGAFERFYEDDAIIRV